MDSGSVAIHLSLNALNRVFIARRFQEMAIPPLAPEIVFHRHVPPGHIRVRDHAIHRFLEREDARFHRQPRVVASQFWIVQPQQ